MEILNHPIVGQVVSICVAGACGFLAAQVKRLSARDKALYEGMKAVLRKQLVDDYDRYVVHGEPMSVERKSEIDDCYAAYVALGGNHTGPAMYEALCRIQPYIIHSREES